MFAISSLEAREKEMVVSHGHREMLSRVTPCVVSVFPARFASNQNLDGAAIERFYSRPQAEEGYRAEGVGSGVIVSEDGWIVTNSHVVKAVSGEVADTIVVELTDRRQFPALLVGTDDKTDIAVLKVDTDGLTPIPIGDSDEVATGDLVFAIGNPFRLGTTATMGMVSATGRSNLLLNGPEGLECFIQTDAAINPGNSGGALVDPRGRLIGINTGIYSRDGGGNLGIGFAIPTRLVCHVASQLVQNGAVNRGFFGISIEPVSVNPVESGKGESVRGARVSDLMRRGPGESAGLKQGDVILKVGDRETNYWLDVRMELAYFEPGDTAKLVISRDGKVMSMSAVATEFPGTESDAGFSIGRLPGVTFRAVEDGVAVVTLGSYRPETGDWFRVGMTVVEVNKEAVDSGQAMEKHFKHGVNRVVVEYERRRRTLAIRLETK